MRSALIAADEPLEPGQSANVAHMRGGVLIDAQVHAYAPAGTDAGTARPAEAVAGGSTDVTAETVIAVMDRLGVDRALLVSPWIPYREDVSHAIEASRRHPHRLRVVAPFHEQVADLDAKLERWAGTPEAAGMRLLVGEDPDPDAVSPGVETVVRSAARSELPLCLPVWGRLDYARVLFARFPRTQFVLDHLALPQPPYARVPEDPFEGIAEVAALSRFDNVAIKLTGMCTLSRAGFPFADVWERVGEIVTAFGPRRCMWGTDWTRTRGIVSPDDAVRSFRDHWPGSDGEWRALAGETADAVFRWSPTSSSDTPPRRRRLPPVDEAAHSRPGDGSSSPDAPDGKAPTEAP